MRLARSPIWTCNQRTPACRFGHVRIDVRHSNVVAEYRFDGFLLWTCTSCEPSTYAFGIASSYHDLLTMYDISRTQLDHIRTLSPSVKAIEVLEYLGYSGDAA